MKLLFFRWRSFMRWGIERALNKLNIDYDVYEYDFADWEEDEGFCLAFGQALRAHRYDAVLSVNFAPLVSGECQGAGIKYISWVYDAPLHIRDLAPLCNDCNEIYFFDKMQAAEYAAAGIHAYHMPLAASPEVFEPAIRAEDGINGGIRRYQSDISMVGKLYDTELARYAAPLEPYLRGYLEGILGAQIKLYGAYIIPDMITDELLASINACYAKTLGAETSGGSFAMGKRELEYMLACEVTGRERRLALSLLAGHYDTTVYSDTPVSLPCVKNGGPVDYLTQMPLVFNRSRINLNISLKAIRTGIPLRVLDIMACGGFVLTNYQQEVEELLCPGKACAVYDSIEDLYEKAGYYLKHDGERAAAAAEGKRLVEREFNFEDKLRAILKTGAKAEKIKKVEKVEKAEEAAENASDKESYDALIMVTPQDFLRLRGNYRKLIDCIPARRVLFVGSRKVGELLETAGLGERAVWLDEEDILSFDKVYGVMKERMKELLAGRELPRKLAGWYYQQFLKMEYANLCGDRYYMVWDGDTIPCGKFTMFDEKGLPYLDLKHEYHEEYFTTLSKLIPDMHKCMEKSFIAEHMLIRCDLMKELIAQMEKADIFGESFWEKVLYSIELSKIQSNSFSEFETYGTYVSLKAPSEYALRDWHSFRYGGEFFHPDRITQEDYAWLGRDFAAISFEKGHSVREDHENLFNNKAYQEKLSARQMLELAQEDFEEDCYKEIWE